MPLFIFVTRFFAPILISPSCKVALSSNYNILRAKKVLQEYNFYSKVEPFKMIFLSYRVKRLQKVWLIKKNTLTLPL